MIPDLVGKVGGQNFQRGLASPTLRNISTKRKFIIYPQIAPNAINHRATFAFVSAAWRGLSSTVRSNWAAATPSFPRTNKFGTVYTPSAFQLFCEFNFALTLIGLDLNSSTPTVATFVSPIWAVVYDSGAGTITISQSVVYTASPYKTIIAACFYQSNGKGLRKSTLKDIASHQFTIASASYDITAQITSVFGAIIPGTTMFVSVKQVFLTTGEFNQAQYFSISF